MPNNQKIPEGWSVKRLGECVEGTQLGGNYENSESNKGLPLIKMGNLSRGKIVLDKIEYIPENTIHNEKDILHYGDLLFNTRNTLELVGKVSIWKNELPTALFNSNILRFTFNPSIIKNSFFMNYYFNSEKGLKLLRARAIGTTSVAAIYWRDCINMKILLPPLAEQEKIALVLGTWDEAIEKLSNLIEQKKNLKKGLMQKLLTGKTRLSGFTQPWKDCELSDLLDYEQPSKYIVNEILEYSKTKPPVLTANKAFILGSTDDTSGIYTKGTCIIFDDFTTDIKYVDFPFKVKSSAIKILTPKKGAVLKFVFEQMKRIKYPLGGHKRYYLSEYQYITISIPDTKEQQAIADVLSTADDEINLLNQKLEALKEQKKGLMQQLLTGQTRVKVN